jgi:alpha-glucosidase (family GH31 glycosyl hydrolase)
MGYESFVLTNMGAHPHMPTQNVFVGDKWRIGIITDSLVRFEWSESGQFEDNATQAVLNRSFEPHPSFTSHIDNGLLIIETPSMRISYDMKPFSKEGLSLTVTNVSLNSNTWHYSDASHDNLGGTARTLDEADGAIPLDDGILARSGWAVLDDSKSNVIVETGSDAGDEPANPYPTWVVPRDHEETDIYVFAYGHHYKDAIRDFYKLTGPTPLIPKFALGNWWSRYHDYSEGEYRELVERFEKEEIPFSVSVIDMDWHLTTIDPKYGSSWTGYTWNRELFPDPTRFLHFLHSHGLHTTLNVHPRDGIRAFENAYPAVAQAMGIDPASGEPVEFDLTSPKFVSAYFNQLHHPLEDQGVDFWWVDWQQGGTTRQKGLDPLWMLNHLHYLDSKARHDRGLTFSRYAGPGSHRYPIGFSGDSVVSWDSLQFQPYFTTTASNIGYGWWSHDIGGHMLGERDEELEARWYQLGALSPINRLHSTASPFNGKEPWNFHEPARGAMTAALRLRNQLVPYLNTMNWRAASDSMPLVEPLYWEYPDTWNAYEFPNEYFFGSQLLAAPVTSKIDHASLRAATNVWLPQGTWLDFFTGRHYSSSSADGRRMQIWRTLESIPVFARAGAIVPMQPAMTPIESNPSSLEVIVFPGADGEFTLVEDNGTTTDPTACARTEMTLDWAGRQFSIAAPTGDLTNAGLPETRWWTVKFRGITAETAHNVTVAVDGVALDSANGGIETQYNPATLTLTIALPEIPISSAISIALGDNADIAQNPTLDDCFALLFEAQMPYLTKEKVLGILQNCAPNDNRDYRNRRDYQSALNSLLTLEDTKTGREAMFNSHLPADVFAALSEIVER